MNAKWKATQLVDAFVIRFSISTVEAGRILAGAIPKSRQQSRSVCCKCSQHSFVFHFLRNPRVVLLINLRKQNKSHSRVIIWVTASDGGKICSRECDFWTLVNLSACRSGSCLAIKFNSILTASMTIEWDFMTSVCLRRWFHRPTKRLKRFFFANFISQSKAIEKFPFQFQLTRFHCDIYFDVNSFSRRRLIKH